MKIVLESEKYSETYTWIKGSFTNRGCIYKFSSKTYVEPHEFCINGGLISCLWVTNSISGKRVISYDKKYDYGDIRYYNI